MKNKHTANRFLILALPLLWLVATLTVTAAPPIAVNSATPNEAERGTVQLPVTISGRGFQENSEVEFFISGTCDNNGSNCDPGGISVQPESVNVVNSKKLEVIIDVDVNAIEGLFDIEIRSNGRRGRGTELFRVLQKGGGGNGGIVFDAVLIGEADEFPGGRLGFGDGNACSTTGAIIFVGGLPDDVLIRDHGLSSVLGDQVFGKGGSGLTANADGMGVHFFSGAGNNSWTGGTNRVAVQGKDGTCNGKDPAVGHADVRLSLDRTTDCDGGTCVWVTDFRGGSVMTDEKYARCAVTEFPPPGPAGVKLFLTGSTTINLFHRCDIHQGGNNRFLGTVSWGKIVLTAR